MRRKQLQTPAIEKLATLRRGGIPIKDLLAKNIRQSIQDTKSVLFIIVSPVPNAHCWHSINAYPMKE